MPELAPKNGPPWLVGLSQWPRMTEGCSLAGFGGGVGFEARSRTGSFAAVPLTVLQQYIPDS